MTGLVPVIHVGPISPGRKFIPAARLRPLGYTWAHGFPSPRRDRTSPVMTGGASGTLPCPGHPRRSEIGWREVRGGGPARGRPHAAGIRAAMPAPRSARFASRSAANAAPRSPRECWRPSWRATRRWRLRTRGWGEGMRKRRSGEAGDGRDRALSALTTQIRSGRTIKHRCKGELGKCIIVSYLLALLTNEQFEVLKSDK